MGQPYLSLPGLSFDPELVNLASELVERNSAPL
jgi:hypothetical protein